MAAVRNISTGPRGAYLDGVLVWAEPGQSIEADDFAEEWFEEVDGAEAVSLESQAGSGGDPSNDEIVEERNGFQLISVGGGHWHIRVPGEDESVKVRGEDAARARFDELAGE